MMRVGIMTCDLVYVRFDLVTTEWQWFLKENYDHPFVISHDKKNMKMNEY